MQLFMNLVSLLAVATTVATAVSHTPKKESALSLRRRSVNSSASPLVVDLDYAVYEGVYNTTIGLNTWLGMRYAAPPTGTRRWQPPREPKINTTGTLPANTQPIMCPQSYQAPTTNYDPLSIGVDSSEDCLFLNVYAPRNATNLPVFFWIHGGGYGYGSASEFDPSDFIHTNNNGFIAVIIQYRALLEKRVNGVRILAGNNANEAATFTPLDIFTEDDFISFIQTSYPQLTEEDIEKTLAHYPSTNATMDPLLEGWSTLGTSPPTALNWSDIATGQLQRAMNLYAETTFQCSAYWILEAFTRLGKSSFRYQYSIPPAVHALDLGAIFDSAGYPGQTADFRTAIQSIWGNFIINNDPSISPSIAAGSSSGANSTAFDFMSSWPVYTSATPYMVDLNITGGIPISAQLEAGTPNVTVLEGSDIKNWFRLVNAWTWEGGRGPRCDFWQSIGRSLPE